MDVPGRLDGAGRRRGIRPELSGQARPHCHGRARGQPGPDGAADRAEARRAPGPAGHHRQPGRAPLDGDRGQGAGRWLHAAPRQRQPLDLTVPAGPRGLGSDPGLCADHAAGDFAQHPGRASVVAGAVHQGIDRAGPEQGGRAQLFLGPDGLFVSHRGGIIQVHGARQHRARCLQRPGGGDALPDYRRIAGEFPQRGFSGAFHAVGKIKGPGGDDRPALRAGSRPADGGGGGTAGL